MFDEHVLYVMHVVDVHDEAAHLLWDFGLRFAHVASDIGHLLVYDFHILSDALMLTP